MTFTKKTSLRVFLLSLLLLFACVGRGWCMTTSATSQSITIPITQWQTLKSELTALSQELIVCQTELQTLKRPSAELLNELTTAQNLLAKLRQELTESKEELEKLSSEAAEYKTSLQTLKDKINKERSVHRRQVWQNRVWCLLIGVCVGKIGWNG